MPESILWVAATAQELVGLPSTARTVVTGVGPAAAAAGLALELARGRPSRIVGLGIAGAYPGAGLELDDVVQIEQDSFVDLGVRTPEGFLGIWELGIPQPGVPEQIPSTPWSRLDFLRGVRGGTCSVCTGTMEDAQARSDAGAQVETMEGAAWGLVAIRSDIPFHHLRAISNVAGPRERDRWRIREALLRLAEAVERILA